MIFVLAGLVVLRISAVIGSLGSKQDFPRHLQGFLALSAPVLGPGASLDPVLRQMIAHISSAAAGCSYCQAHTAHAAIAVNVAS